MSFIGADGLLLGGSGEFRTTRLNPCRLFVSSFGLRNTLKIITAAWEGKYLIRLFQNDYRPSFSSVASNFQEANFSGYGGELITYSWSVPQLSGIYAISTAHDMVWTHNGGPVSNWIYGYYVLTPSGDYVWGERFCPAPEGVKNSGQKVRVRPLFFLVNDE